MPIVITNLYFVFFSTKGRNFFVIYNTNFLVTWKCSTHFLSSYCTMIFFEYQIMLLVCIASPISFFIKTSNCKTLWNDAKPWHSYWLGTTTYYQMPRNLPYNLRFRSQLLSKKLETFTIAWWLGKIGFRIKSLLYSSWPRCKLWKEKKGKAQTRQDRQIKIIIIKHWECHCENTNNVGHKVKDYFCKNIKSVIIKTYTKFDKER